MTSGVKGSSMEAKRLQAEHSDVLSLLLRLLNSTVNLCVYVDR